MAFKYLSWALFPLLAGYGVYSLLYHEHKGWYSWVLSMLYGFLLMFGESWNALVYLQMGREIRANLSTEEGEF